MANGCIGGSDGQTQVNWTLYEHGIFRDIGSQCITGQFWKTEVAVLSDQVRLVACRNFDIFGWLSVIYSLKVDQLKQQK